MDMKSSPQHSEKVLDAIVALKKKSEEPAGKDKSGVDLVAIVKRLSSKKEKSLRAKK